uniref:Capsid protein n=1 Tax=Smacoviridae sp. TaxID=2715094 RepID=A0A6M3YRU3_9VIRU|nr:MAG: capsid protein [Smacoviridae sp.]
MVTVRISETYDLSTKVGKMGIVGIHTPTGSLIDKMWPGLVLQYKKMRFAKCDVAMACASMLPADPLQIGVEAGSIAPQDMFNPILYKAVSNDSMSNILAYLMGAAAEPALDFPNVEKGSIVDINESDFSSTGNAPSGGTPVHYDQFKMYYGLLADSDNWRKAMPQSGLTMNNLYPLVYQVISPYGRNNRGGNPSENDWQGGVSHPSMFINGGQVAVPTEHKDAFTFAPYSTTTYNLRGPAMRMPAFDTKYFSETVTKNIVPSGNGASVSSGSGAIPPAYVGLIVLPPAKLNQLYYRLKVTWSIEFTGLHSMADIGAWDTVEAIGGLAFGTDYADQSAKMTANTAMVDTSGADIQKIMEGS